MDWPARLGQKWSGNDNTVIHTVDDKIIMITNDNYSVQYDYYDLVVSGVPAARSSHPEFVLLDCTWLDHLISRTSHLDCWAPMQVRQRAQSLLAVARKEVITS